MKPPGEEYDKQSAGKPGKDQYVLQLYVTGATPNSLRAVTNIRNICNEFLKGNYSLRIIDVYLHPDQAATEQLVALPMLIKAKPGPRRKLIGDMSDTQKVLESLGIK